MPNGTIINSGKYNLRKLTRPQVQKVIISENVFNGFMCGNKVNSYHIADGWCLGHAVELTSIDDLNEQIEKMTTSLLVYTPELGSYPHYYQIMAKI